MSSIQGTIPGPKPVKGIVGIVKLMNQFQRDLLGSVRYGFQKYGDLYRYQIGGLSQVLISHPDHIHTVLVSAADQFQKDRDYKDRKRGLARFLGNGLVTSDGEFWKRQRKLIQPAFHHKRIATYAETMVNTSAAMIAGWRDGAQIDVDQEMMRATLIIVAKALFNTDISHDTNRIGEAMTVLQEMASTPNFLPAWIPTFGERKIRRAVRDMDEIVYQLIAERRADSSDQGDLISMLVAARDDQGQGMTDEQIRDELVTLFLAGHETTANALNWTWYLLAQHPQVEAKLHHELDAVLGGRLPTLEDLPNLPYTEWIIKESMRLYPPVYGFSREALQEVEIGGYIIPKGATVTIMNYVAHQDPRWWGDDAAQFIPERFDESREKEIPRYAYVPFGGGPRICIGNSFAMMESRLMLAVIAQRFTLRLQPGQIVTPNPLVTLRPKGGLPMTIHARQIPQMTPEGILEQAPQPHF